MFPKNRKKSLIEKDSQALWLFCLFWLCGVTQLGQRLLQGLFIFYIYPHKVTCSKDRNPPAQCYRAMLQLKHHRCYCQFLAEQFSIWYCHCKSKLKKKAITGRTLLQICVRDVHVWDVHVCYMHAVERQLWNNKEDSTVTSLGFELKKLKKIRNGLCYWSTWLNQCFLSVLYNNLSWMRNIWEIFFGLQHQTDKNLLKRLCVSCVYIRFTKMYS